MITKERLTDIKTGKATKLNKAERILELVNKAHRDKVDDLLKNRVIKLETANKLKNRITGTDILWKIRLNRIERKKKNYISN